MPNTFTQNNDYLTFYVGTYGNKMYAFRFNPRTLECRQSGEVQVSNSSYIALSLPQNTENKKNVPATPQYIYAITENGKQSAISAFKTEAVPEGKDIFEYINTQTEIGPDPCYLSYHNGHLITANYTGGSVSVFRTCTQTGALLPATQTLAYPALSPEELALRDPATAKRQQGAHIHTVRPVPQKNIQAGLSGPPAHQYLLATDLGCDQIRLFKIIPDQKSTGEPAFTLTPNTPEAVPMPAGSGPRHIAFGTGNHSLYVLNELSGNIFVYLLAEQNDNLQLSPVQEIISDPTGAQACGDIKMHPSGKFLYTTNRRQNDGVAVYQITDPASGRLEQTGYIRTARHPRNIAITPAGDFLFVAAKEDKKIEIYAIHPETGQLSRTGKEIVFTQEEPVCIAFRPIKPNNPFIRYYLT